MRVIWMAPRNTKAPPQLKYVSTVGLHIRLGEAPTASAATPCRVYANRLLQNAYNSPTKRRKDAELFDAALRIGEALYALPLEQQLGYMQDLIAQAREGNSKLRQILTNRKLLKPNSVNELWLFPNGTPMYCTIAQDAKRYCWKF